jgi:hypothetical protein
MDRLRSASKIPPDTSSPLPSSEPHSTDPAGPVSTGQKIGRAQCAPIQGGNTTKKAKQKSEIYKLKSDSRKPEAFPTFR